jgi:hypothetical protein
VTQALELAFAEVGPAGGHETLRSGFIDAPGAMRVWIPHDGDLDGSGESALDGAPCLARRREQLTAPVLDAVEAARVGVESSGGNRRARVVA